MCYFYHDTCAIFHSRTQFMHAGIFLDSHSEYKESAKFKWIRAREFLFFCNWHWTSITIGLSKDGLYYLKKSVSIQFIELILISRWQHEKQCIKDAL